MLLAFGDHVLDSEQRELRCGAELVAVEPQVFDLLVYLVQHHDRVVSKDDLLQAVWGGRIVSDAALAARINAARRALGDNGKAQRWIRTLPRKGVRFIGAVREEPEAAPASSPPPRLSIVVLPFTNLSDDREQQYFADGITEDLTTDLSRIAHSFVISRSTAFTYRNKSVDTKQIGHELGVRYVLEGSVRRSGSGVRVTAQLIDAATDAHLWAEIFDSDTVDLFSLQNEITSALANALGVELIVAEAARPTEHPDAFDYILRGRATLLKSRTPDIYREAINLFEHASALDPQSVEAQGRLSIALTGRVLDAMSGAPAVDIARAEGLVGQALAASPRSALAHFAKGHMLQAQDRWEEAIPEFETVLVFNRNWVAAISNLGLCKFFTGSIEEAIRLLEQAIRISPRDPSIGHWYFRIGTAYLVQSRVDDAIVWAQKGRSADPGNPRRYALLASALALRGQTERAAAELAEARRLSGDNRYSSIASLKVGLQLGVPKVRALFETTIFAGLRKAGMPER
jgi:TolB-like protein/Flp pilus assembly protein TadD